MRHAGGPRFELAPAIQAEHIFMESEDAVVDERARGKRVGPTLTIASRLRGCETELALMDDHRLAVRARRRRRRSLQYMVDLRFVDAKPVLRRRIAWRCWQASVTLAALAAASHWAASLQETQDWMPAGWPFTLILATAAFAVGVVALYRTNDTIEFRSAHGRTALVALTGNLGCSRASASFTDEIGRWIADARARLPQSRQRFLRDEMREHRRLLDSGVLSAQAYEEGKRRILQAHE